MYVLRQTIWTDSEPACEGAQKSPNQWGYKYVCNSRAHYAQQPSTIIMHPQGGMAYYIRAALTSQHSERPSPSNLRYITGPQPTRPPDLPSPYQYCTPLVSSFQLSGIPFYLLLTSGIACAVSYITSIAGTCITMLASESPSEFAMS